MVTVKLDKMDWKMLREQKAQLVTAADTHLGEFAWGLVALLDELQDQAAEQIGKQAVFGDREDND
jgi:hypothetical protein